MMSPSQLQWACTVYCGGGQSEAGGRPSGCQAQQHAGAVLHSRIPHGSWPSVRLVPEAPSPHPEPPLTGGGVASERDRAREQLLIAHRTAMLLTLSGSHVALRTWIQVNGLCPSCMG